MREGETGRERNRDGEREKEREIEGRKEKGEREKEREREGGGKGGRERVTNKFVKTYGPDCLSSDMSYRNYSLLLLLQ